MLAGDDVAEGLHGGILRDFAAPTHDHASSQNPEVARQLAARLGKQAQRLEIRAVHIKYHHRLRLEYLCLELRDVRPGLPAQSF